MGILVIAVAILLILAIVNLYLFVDNKKYEWVMTEEIFKTCFSHSNDYRVSMKCMEKQTNKEVLSGTTIKEKENNYYCHDWAWGRMFFVEEIKVKDWDIQINIWNLSKLIRENGKLMLFCHNRWEYKNDRNTFNANELVYK